MTLEQDRPAAGTGDAGAASDGRPTRSPASRRAALRPLLWRLQFVGGSVHSALGVGVLAALLLMVGTGLTWTSPR